MLTDKHPGIHTRDSTPTNTVLNNLHTKVVEISNLPIGGTGKSKLSTDNGMSDSAVTITSWSTPAAGAVVLNIMFSNSEVIPAGITLSD